MTEMEEKSLKAQLELHKEIRSADNMIIHTVQSTAMGALKKIIEPKMYFKDKQEVVELTTDEFTELRLTLARLASNDGFKELNGWINEKYIAPKDEQLKILNILQ